MMAKVNVMWELQSAATGAPKSVLREGVAPVPRSEASLLPPNPGYGRFARGRGIESIHETKVNQL